MSFDLESARRRLASFDPLLAACGAEAAPTPPLERTFPRPPSKPARPIGLNQEERSLLYWEAFVDRLTWQHGAERTCDILDGRDPATQADIAAWNRLGSLFGDAA